MTANECARQFLADLGMRPDLIDYTLSLPDCNVAALAKAGGWVSPMASMGMPAADLFGPLPPRPRSKKWTYSSGPR